MKKFITIMFVLLMAISVFQKDAIAESVTKAVTAENQWTDPIYPKHMPGTSAAQGSERLYSKNNDYGTLNLSISGTWVGTVTLQEAYDFGTAWQSTGETWTSNASKIITKYEPGVSFRIGIATGDYTSGTCNVRLSK